MKGFELDKAKGNFKIFSCTRNLSYDLDEFIDLCEGQAKKCFDYVGEYQGHPVFKLTQKHPKEKVK